MSVQASPSVMARARSPGRPPRAAFIMSACVRVCVCLPRAPCPPRARSPAPAFLRAQLSCFVWGGPHLTCEYLASCRPACVGLGRGSCARFLPPPPLRPVRDRPARRRTERCVRSARSLYCCCGRGSLCIPPYFGAPCPPACVVGVTVSVRALCLCAGCRRVSVPVCDLPAGRRACAVFVRCFIVVDGVAYVYCPILVRHVHLRVWLG